MTDLTTSARPYARAAFEYAVSKRELANWNNALKELALILEDKSLISFIHNPHSTPEQVLSVITRTFGKDLTKNQENFIRLLQEYHRLTLLPEIARLFAEYVKAEEKTIDVEVTSVFPLGDVIQTKLTQALERRLGLGVTIKCKIDPSILGGAIIRAGDMVIDGSVLSKIQHLHEEIVA